MKGNKLVNGVQCSFFSMFSDIEREGGMKRTTMKVVGYLIDHE